MNILTQNQSMTSIEIAKLVETEHRNVKVSIERLIKRGVIRDAPMTNLEKINNLGFKNKVGVYIFNGEQGKRDSIIVVAQLCPEFTARLVDRWQELEKKEQFYIPQTYGDALQLCADQAKQLELQAPKVNFYDKLVDRTTLMNATQVGQKFKMSAVKLNKLLVELDVYSKKVKRGKVFKQWFIDQGLGEMKQTEDGYTQALFTTKGEQWVFEKLSLESAI